MASCVAILCFTIFFLNKNNEQSSNNNPDQPTENIVVNQNSNTAIAQTTNTDTEEKVNVAGISIPIFMYHYIRDLNDPNDKIGTNLSVSPEKFASQLDLIKSKGYTTITFKDIMDGNIPDKPVILTFDDGYKDFYTNAYPELKKRDMKAVSYIITGNIKKDGYMSAEEINKISNDNIEIGSHTVSHPDMSKATTARAEMEARESKRILGEITEKPIISICYPSGKYNSETEKIVKDYGYSYAVTTNIGITSFADPFALNRYRLNHDTNISSYIK